MASRVLEALMLTLPMVKEIFGLDVQICLCDKEQTIGVWYADTFRMDVEVGERIDKNKPGHDMMIKAIETGIGNSGILPEFVYGVAVDGIITPVFEDGKVVGAVSAAVSIKDKKEIEQAADSLNRNLISSREITNEIANEVSDLAGRLERCKTFSLKIKEHTKEASSIVKKIQGNSHKSDILAINAAIEAARAGEKGRGFSIVAKEMGNLAKESGDSSKSISNLFEEMFDKLNGILTEIDTVADISTTQAAAMEEMSATLDEITQDAGKLAKTAQIKSH